MCLWYSGFLFQRGTRVEILTPPSSIVRLAVPVGCIVKVYFGLQKGSERKIPVFEENGFSRETLFGVQNGGTRRPSPVAWLASRRAHRLRLAHRDVTATVGWVPSRVTTVPAVTSAPTAELESKTHT